MKINPNLTSNPIGQVASDGKRQKITDSAGDKFAAILAETEQAQASAAKPVAPMRAIERVMVVSPSGDALEQRKRGQKRGHRLLDQLERIRHALLSGSLSMAAIEDLVADLATEKAQIDDPHLMALLDEIDLRAQVELAKYQSKNNL